MIPVDLGRGDALLIVDVQNDFCPGGALPIPDGDRVVPVLNEWTEAADRAGVPVYASRDWHPRGHPSFAPEGLEGEETPIPLEHFGRSIRRGVVEDHDLVIPPELSHYLAELPEQRVLTSTVADDENPQRLRVPSCGMCRDARDVRAARGPRAFRPGAGAIPGGC